MGVFEDTQLVMRGARERSAKTLLAFSGGKDSLVCLALCLRTFEETKPFFMYFIPGLTVVDEMIAKWEKILGVKIDQVPHWKVSRKLKDYIYRVPPIKLMEDGYIAVDPHAGDDIDAWSLDEIYSLQVDKTGIPIIVTGAKKSDSMWRRRQMGTWGNQDRMIYPLRNWNKFDVLQFLKTNRLPLPESSGRNANGIDLATPIVLWLYDQHREDYNKIAEVFPLVEAVVWRRQFHGIGAEHFDDTDEKERKRKRNAGLI